MLGVLGILYSGMISIEFCYLKNVGLIFYALIRTLLARPPPPCSFDQPTG